MKLDKFIKKKSMKNSFYFNISSIFLPRMQSTEFFDDCKQNCFEKGGYREMFIYVEKDKQL